MSAAHVRRGRGAPARTQARKPAKVTVPKRIAKKLPVDQARANKLAGLVFTAFLLAIGVVVLVALDIPAKAERSAGAAIGQAGFVVSGYQIVGLRHMDRAPIDEVVTDELRRAADEAGATAPATWQRRHPGRHRPTTAPRPHLPATAFRPGRGRWRLPHQARRSPVAGEYGGARRSRGWGADIEELPPHSHQERQIFEVPIRPRRHDPGDTTNVQDASLPRDNLPRREAPTR